MGAEAAISRLQSLIQSKDMEIEDWVKEQARLNKPIKDYQERIEAIPVGEREYVQLTRDYNLAKTKYEELMMKSNQSSMATELEDRKQGEGLEVLEQASLPQTPTEPNRWILGHRRRRSGPWLGSLPGGRQRDEGHVAEEPEGRQGLHRLARSG